MFVGVISVVVAVAVVVAVGIIAPYCGIDFIRFDQSSYGICRCNNIKRSSTKHRRREGALD